MMKKTIYLLLFASLMVGCAAQQADRKVIITKKDEKFIRSLSPNQMVLFFVKLKKFRKQCSHATI